MQVTHIKALRRALIGLITLVLLAVSLNYLQTWRKRARTITQAAKILTADMLRSADGIEYSDHENGRLKFKVHAARLVETRRGRSLLQGIEAFDFDPDGTIRNQIRSRRAEYARTEKKALFTGDVRVRMGDRLELRTESLSYDLRENRGETGERIELYSPQASGTAEGVVYDHSRQTLELKHNLDFTLKRTVTGPGGSANVENLRVAADRGFYSRNEHLIEFVGGARMKSETDLLSGESIKATFHPESGRVTSLLCRDAARYESSVGPDVRILSGEQIRFGISATTGVLEHITVDGGAGFKSVSPVAGQDLQAERIEVDLDPLLGVPLRLDSLGSVRFESRHSEQISLISGSSMEATFVPGTNLIRQMQVRGDARIKTSGKEGSGGEELRAEALRIWFQGNRDQSLPGKLIAEHSVRWRILPDPGQSGGSERSLEASLLEMDYAEGGNFLDRGRASGKVILSGVPAGGADLSEIKRLEADKVRFGFHPGKNALRDFDGEGNIVVTQKVASRGENPEQSFQTRSDFIRATFREKDGAAQTISQWGDFVYEDGPRRATAGEGDYRADADLMTLRTNPRIIDESGITTGDRIDYDRKQKVLSVRGRVRTILSPRDGPSGGPFSSTKSSASPSVVTAESMEYRSDPSRARYEGSVVLLSSEGQVRAGVLEIHNGGERVDAREGVQHVVFRAAGANDSGASAAKRGQGAGGTDRQAQAVITCGHLAYGREQNALHYSENVQLRSEDVVMESDRLHAVLDNAGGQIDQAAARGEVHIRQAGRDARGEMADYYFSPGKVVVVGSPAQIADPARGKSHARRLTFFTTDHRVLLESY